MSLEEELDRIEAFVLARTGQRLTNTDLQRNILRGAWQGMTYDQIVESYYCHRSHAVEVFAKICQLVSKALGGEEVNKYNFRKVIERIWRTEQSEKIFRTEDPVVSGIQQLGLYPNFVECKRALTNSRQDWGDAPDVSVFLGRTDELTTLEQWIVEERCRLVVLFGLGGIGKTALSVKLAERIQGDFEYLIWRSLSHAPAVQDILADLIEFCSNQQEMVLPNAIDGCISGLMEYLQAHRCLVVLDGLETLLGTGQLAGKYREGYQEYGKLFRQVGESNHKSCLVLTSSEKSRGIAVLEGKTRPVRVYKLEGLKKDAAQEILREQGLIEEEEWGSIIEHYRCNPLYLKIVSALITEVFDGKASEFIKENTIFLGQINEVLEQLFERLSNLEIEVMRQLAIAHKPVSRDRLRELISAPVSSSKLMEVLESLMWRSMIEKVTEYTELLYGLQPVVRKYVINRFCQA